LKTVSLPDLISALESISQPTRAVITDGIISPRLAAIAEKAGAKYIVGQRLHPNLDRSAFQLTCIEMQEFEGRQFDSPVSDEASSPITSPRNKTSDLEVKLLREISASKWLNMNDILASAGIYDEFERNLAGIKLKQMVASNTLVSEVVNNIPFFKKPTP
jgi:hypothetical protein